ncbi:MULTISPECIES: DUF4397 domain-containing protein [unclassified Myroides]|uniref:DUF4397 domain-containing protein n=1 Tax=unclassified Myroides TaxID=2642485 RepID=UPI003D2F7366
MRRIIVLFGLLLSVLFIQGCSLDDNSSDVNDRVGGLTMVNGFSGANAVWYAADGRLIQPPYQGLGYKRYDFVRLYTGDRTLEVLTNQQESLDARIKLQVKDNQYYTSFIGGGSKANVIHFITEDQPLQLAEGQTGIRFFNLTGEDLPVQVRLNEQLIFENRNSETEVSAKENERFIIQSSNTYTLTIEDKEGKSITKREQITLEKGSYYSFILTGSHNAQTPYYLGVVRQF